MAPQLSVVLRRANGEELSVDLPPEVFGGPIRRHLLFEAVRAYLAARRAGTHSTKTRGEVSGGGKKPWRQKGTGRARAGSIRSPLWVGGATVFGPKPRDYAYALPKKARREALRSALAAKLRAGALILVERIELPEAKTRHMAAYLKSLGIERGLMVLSEPIDAVVRAARNLPGVEVVTADELSIYDLLRHPKVVMVASAIEQLKKRLGN